MKVNFGAVPLSAPWDGAVAIAYVNESPSGSFPVNVIETEVSSEVVTLWPFAMGRLLPGPTVVMEIDTVAGELVTCPSETVNVKLSLPE